MDAFTDLFGSARGRGDDLGVRSPTPLAALRAHAIADRLDRPGWALEMRGALTLLWQERDRLTAPLLANIRAALIERMVTWMSEREHNRRLLAALNLPVADAAAAFPAGIHAGFQAALRESLNARLTVALARRAPQMPDGWVRELERGGVSTVYKGPSPLRLALGAWSDTFPHSLVALLTAHPERADGWFGAALTAAQAARAHDPDLWARRLPASCIRDDEQLHARVAAVLAVIRDGEPVISPA